MNTIRVLWMLNISCGPYRLMHFESFMTLLAQVSETTARRSGMLAEQELYSSELLDGKDIPLYVTRLKH